MMQMAMIRKWLMARWLAALLLDTSRVGLFIPIRDIYDTPID